MTARPVALLLALGCTLLAGCRCCHRNPPPPCPPGSVSGRIAPAGIPVIPPPPAPVPGISGYHSGGTELLLPQNPPPGVSRSEYPQNPRVVPADPPQGAVLGDPDAFGSPPATEKPPEFDPLPTEPKKAAPSDRPVGIAEFMQVKDGVSAGQRPDLDGLDWLKAKGYKTVVHVRRPQDSDDTDRAQVEKRGMKFVSLLISPQTLTAEWVDQFNEIVGDTAARPMFVYGQDPQAAAVAWYLHLRRAEFLTHDEARFKAERLGLKDQKSELFQAALKIAPPN
jgi:protein tyrosine phosphatase (PTP) superfamily phosphohydrolase (DUF442 family)